MPASSFSFTYSLGFEAKSSSCEGALDSAGGVSWDCTGSSGVSEKDEGSVSEGAESLLVQEDSTKMNSIKTTRINAIRFISKPPK